MGKYKVGDEVLVKARIVGDRTFVYALETYDDQLFTAKKDEVIPVPDMTAEEAWELAKKILLYPDHELEEIFGRTEPLLELTPQEAKAKIEAWEAEGEIEVGDVVIQTTNAGNEYIGCVTRIISAQDSVHIIYPDGSTNITLTKKLKKTGLHIDIKGILNQIGGSDA